jgi:transposase-like protein
MQPEEKRRRRRHAAAFKAAAIAACRRLGAPVAVVALHLQLNANMLPVWIKRAESALLEAARATERSSLPLSGAGFLPVPLGGESALPGSPTERSIRLQIRRGATSRIRTPA